MRIQKLWKQLNKWLKFRFKEYALNTLLRETAIDISPEPGVFGILNKQEEEMILARLWKDPLFVPLLRKYAEGSNVAMVQAVKYEKHSQALRFNAQFFTYSSLIVKAKKANERAIKKANDTGKNQSQVGE